MQTINAQVRGGRNALGVGRRTLVLLLLGAAVVVAVGIVLGTRTSQAAIAEASFQADLPMPAELSLSAADTTTKAALTLSAADAIADARTAIPAGVGKAPVARFGVVASTEPDGRYRIPDKPTPSWVIVSNDVSYPVSLPVGVTKKIVEQRSYIFVDASGKQYHSLLMTYFEGDSVPPLPAP